MKDISFTSTCTIEIAPCLSFVSCLTQGLQICRPTLLVSPNIPTRRMKAGKMHNLLCQKWDDHTSHFLPPIKSASEGKWTDLPASNRVTTTVPRETAAPQQSNPFGNFLGKQLQQQSTRRPFSSYSMSQPTGSQQLQPPQMSTLPQSPPQTFLQQPTGNNPFRQTIFVPQFTTRMALLGASQ